MLGAINSQRWIVGDRTAIWSVMLKSQPTMFRLLASGRQTHKKRAVTRDTDIVIEGIGRSGNHFATYAFMQAQPKPLDVAHHFHAPAQLILAARWGIPALCLTRDPIEEAASKAIYAHSWLSPVTALKIYRIFHEALLPYKDRLVVSDFKDTTTNFGTVIERVNAKYGRDFGVFDHTDENVKKVSDMIRQEHTENMFGKAERDPMPNKDKEALKPKVRAELERHASLTADCRALYSELVGAGG